MGLGGEQSWNRLVLNHGSSWRPGWNKGQAETKVACKKECSWPIRVRPRRQAREEQHEHKRSISTDKPKNSQKENRNQSGQRWASQLRRNPQRYTPVPPVLRFETGPLRDRLCHTTVPAIFNYTFIISILRISPKHPIISNITMTNETHLKRADGHLQRETWMLPGTSKEALPAVGPKSGSEFPGVQTLDCDSRSWATQIKAHGKRREPLFGGSQGEDSRDVLRRRQEENWRWAKSMVMERSISHFSKEPFFILLVNGYLETKKWVLGVMAKNKFLVLFFSSIVLFFFTSLTSASIFAIHSFWIFVFSLVLLHFHFLELNN